jgi:hypothetical protein
VKKRKTAKITHVIPITKNICHMDMSLGFKPNLGRLAASAGGKGSGSSAAWTFLRSIVSGSNFSSTTMIN